jgi:hypothetical protein
MERGDSNRRQLANIAIARWRIAPDNRRAFWHLGHSPEVPHVNSFAPRMETMSSLAVVTVITRNYVPYARALAISVKEHEPHTPFWVCLADDPGPEFQPPAEWDHWFLARDLKIPAWRRFAFQYTPFELSCALKPFAIQHLFEQGYERVAYLDGDMQVCSPLTDLHRWLDDASIVLTPHDRRARATAPSSHDRLFMIAGAFNAGFLALRRGAVASEFLAWWQARVAKDCVHDLPGGMFVDQKWLDLVPGIFPEVHIVRHLGYNVGHWTLMSFPKVEQQAGRIALEGDSLAIFHFSGFVPDKPERISHHSGCTVANFPALGSLCTHYAERMKNCGDGRELKTCEFSQLTDGTPIQPVWREAIRTDHALLKEIADPFDAGAVPNLVKLFQQAEPDLANNREVWRIANLQRRFKKHVERPAVVNTLHAPQPHRPHIFRRWGKSLEQTIRQFRYWCTGAHHKLERFKDVARHN